MKVLTLTSPRLPPSFPHSVNSKPEPMSKSGGNQPVDRYLRRQVLGEGTYGVVYKATDTKVNQSDSKPFPNSIFIRFSIPHLFDSFAYRQVRP